jgi:ADP-ribose pyrophosphatase YjhB (NUDIX family)
MNENVNESDFDWTNDIPDNPVNWVEPEVTYDNVERDEDGWPNETGDGSGEVWVDFESYSNDERIDIIRGIEEYLGKLRIHEDGGNIYACTSNQKKGLIIHCGHEDNHFFAQENHVCCMAETYDEFMEMERNENPSTSFVVRPRVDGGIFLNKTLTEGFYYKGVNPTVDLIVIRGNKVLLIQRGDDAEAEPGKWALPGGFHDTNAKEGEEWKEDKESSLDAAKREVKEETGLDVDSIRGLIFQMVGVFEGGGRDPRDKEDAWTRSTVYMVHIPEDEGEDVKGMDDAQRAEWVPIDKVLQHKLAFDHHKIIEKALSMNMNEAKEILKTLLTESNDFGWTEDVPKIPIPKIGDKFVWGSHKMQEPITITNIEHDSDYMDTVIEFKSNISDFTDAYEYKNWILDYEDGVIKPMLKEDFDWIRDVEFKVTDDYIKSLMANCEDIPITNYNITTHSPYIRRGKMNIMYYSMCPYWWDLLKDEPVDENGRGKGEWFVRSNPDNSVAVIMPNRNGVTDIRGMDLDDYSAITYDLSKMSNYFNGKSSELWIFLDKDGNPRYDLVPDHLVDEVKEGFEGVERSTTLEESFEWTEDIPGEIDEELWHKIADDIDNTVSGPHSGNMRQLFPNLTKVLRKYNIDIDDMGEFFMFPPDGARDKDGNHITNHQLVELQKDLIRIGVSLTPEQERELNLESVNESDLNWVDETKKYPYVGMKFRYEGKGILYTVTEVTNNLVTIKWVKPKYGGVMKKTADLSQVEGLIRDKTWVPVINESNDFEWMDNIKPSWLRIGQKFTNNHNLKMSRRYEPKDMVQVGASTFEIFDINDKHGEPHLRFTHNDVMSRPNWERKRDDEIGQNYGGTKFTQAKHNIDSGFWIPLTDCEFIESSHPNLVGKTKPDGSPYGHIYCLPDTSFEHMSNIKESNDFEWTKDAMDYEGYRFFDIHVCYENFYDEETGEDECDEGGSYFIKIPKDETEKIWKLDVWDNGGPGDEGLGVIGWAEKNDLMNEDYDDVDYVVEVPRNEFCRAVGHSNRDICPESQLKESEFDWTEEIPQADEFVLGKRYFIDFTIEEGDEGVTSFRGVKLRGEVLDMMELLGYDVKSIKATDIDFLYLNDEQYGGGNSITKPNTYMAHWDMARNDEDLDEIYDYVREDKFTTLKPSDFLRMGDEYLKKT